MGSKVSTNNNNHMEEVENINEDSLDLSNIDKLQIKVLKEVIKRFTRIKRKKVR